MVAMRSHAVSTASGNLGSVDHGTWSAPLTISRRRGDKWRTYNLQAMDVCTGGPWVPTLSPGTGRRVPPPLSFVESLTEYSIVPQDEPVDQIPHQQVVADQGARPMSRGRNWPVLTALECNAAGQIGDLSGSCGGKSVLASSRSPSPIGRLDCPGVSTIGRVALLRKAFLLSSPPAFLPTAVRPRLFERVFHTDSDYAVEVVSPSRGASWPDPARFLRKSTAAKSPLSPRPLFKRSVTRENRSRAIVKSTGSKEVPEHVKDALAHMRSAMKARQDRNERLAALRRQNSEREVDENKKNKRKKKLDIILSAEEQLALECFENSFAPFYEFSSAAMFEALADLGIMASSLNEKVEVAQAFSDFEHGSRITFRRFSGVLAEARTRMRVLHNSKLENAWYEVVREAEGMRLEDVRSNASKISLMAEGRMYALGKKHVFRVLELLGLKPATDAQREKLEIEMQTLRPDKVAGWSLGQMTDLAEQAREFHTITQRAVERDLKKLYGLSTSDFDDFRPELLQFHEAFNRLEEGKLNSLTIETTLELMAEMGLIGLDYLNQTIASAEFVTHFTTASDFGEHGLDFIALLAIVRRTRKVAMEQMTPVVSELFRELAQHATGEFPGLLNMVQLSQLLLQLGLWPSTIKLQSRVLRRMADVDDTGTGHFNEVTVLRVVQLIVETYGSVSFAEVTELAAARGFVGHSRHLLRLCYELILGEDGLPRFDLRSVSEAAKALGWKLPADKLRSIIVAVPRPAGSAPLEGMEHAPYAFGTFLEMMALARDEVEHMQAREVKAEEAARLMQLQRA